MEYVQAQALMSVSVDPFTLALAVMDCETSTWGATPTLTVTTFELPPPPQPESASKARAPALAHNDAPVLGNFVNTRTPKFSSRRSRRRVRFLALLRAAARHYRTS
jgi:hypothetical protein